MTVYIRVERRGHRVYTAPMNALVRRALLCLTVAGCHSMVVADQPASQPASVPAPQRITSSKAQATDLYIKGYNGLVDATAKHLISAHSSALTLAEMAHLMPRFGVQHELMKPPLRDAREAFRSAQALDADLAARVGADADALLANVEATTESFHHLSDYYDRAGFQVDNEAQKETLASDFEDKEQAYVTARARLEKDIEACNDELALEELQRFEVTRSYGYWVRRVDYDGKLLERALRNDPAQFHAARAQFNATVAQTQTFANAHHAIKTFAKLLPALATMGVSAERLEVLLSQKGDKLNIEIVTFERAYGGVAKLTSRLYDMEAQGGLE